MKSGHLAHLTLGLSLTLFSTPAMTLLPVFAQTTQPAKNNTQVPQEELPHWLQGNSIVIYEGQSTLDDDQRIVFEAILKQIQDTPEEHRAVYLEAVLETYEIERLTRSDLETAGIIQPRQVKKRLGNDAVESALQRREQADKLVEELATADEARVRAIEDQLLSLGEPAMISLKLAQLSDNFELRQRVHILSARLRWRSVYTASLQKEAPQLIQIMTGDDTRQQSELIDQIIKAEVKQAVGFYRECLAEDDTYLRQRAIVGLQQSAKHQRNNVVNALNQALSDPDRNIRLLAIAALSKLRAIDPESLRPFLSDTSLEVRSTAIMALGQSRKTDAVPILLDALSDPQWRIRSVAIEALEDLVDEDNRDQVKMASKPLMDLFNDPDSFVARQAMELAIEWSMPGMDEYLLKEMRAGKLSQPEALKLLATMKSAEGLKLIQAKFDSSETLEDKNKWISLLVGYENESVSERIWAFLEEDKEKKYWPELLVSLRWTDHMQRISKHLIPSLADDDDAVSELVYRSISHRLTEYRVPDEVLDKMYSTKRESMVYRALSADLAKAFATNTYDRRGFQKYGFEKILKRMQTLTPEQRGQVLSAIAARVFQDDLGINTQIPTPSYYGPQHNKSERIPIQDDLLKTIQQMRTSETLKEKLTATAFLILARHLTIKDKDVNALIKQALTVDDQATKQIAMHAIRHAPIDMAPLLDMSEVFKNPVESTSLLTLGLNLKQTQSDWWPELVSQYESLPFDMDETVEIDLAAINSGDEKVHTILLAKVKNSRSWEYRNILERLSHREDKIAVDILMYAWEYAKKENDEYDLERYAKIAATIKHDDILPLLPDVLLVLEKDRWGDKNLVKTVRKRLVKSDPNAFKFRLLEQLENKNSSTADAALHAYIEDKPTVLALKDIAEIRSNLNISAAGAYKLTQWLPEEARLQWYRDYKLPEKVRQGMLSWLISHPTIDPAPWLNARRAKTDFERHVYAFLRAKQYPGSASLPENFDEINLEDRPYVYHAASAWVDGDTWIMNRLSEEGTRSRMAKVLLQSLNEHAQLYPLKELDEAVLLRLQETAELGEEGLSLNAVRALKQHAPERVIALKLKNDDVMSRLWRLNTKGVKADASDRALLKAALNNKHGDDGKTLALAAHHHFSSDELFKALPKNTPIEQLLPLWIQHKRGDLLMAWLIKNQTAGRYYTLLEHFRPHYTKDMELMLQNQDISKLNDDVKQVLTQHLEIQLLTDDSFESRFMAMVNQPSYRIDQLADLVLEAPESPNSEWMKANAETLKNTPLMHLMTAVKWHDSREAAEKAMETLIDQMNRDPSLYMRFVTVIYITYMLDDRLSTSIKQMLDSPEKMQQAIDSGDHLAIHRNWFTMFLLVSKDYRELLELEKAGYKVYEANGQNLLPAYALLLSAADDPDWLKMVEKASVDQYADQLQASQLQPLLTLIRDAEALKGENTAVISHPTTAPSTQPASKPLTSQQLRNQLLMHSGDTMDMPQTQESIEWPMPANAEQAMWALQLFIDTGLLTTGQNAHGESTEKTRSVIEYLAQEDQQLIISKAFESSNAIKDWNVYLSLEGIQSQDYMVFFNSISAYLEMLIGEQRGIESIVQMIPESTLDTYFNTLETEAQRYHLMLCLSDNLNKKYELNARDFLASDDLDVALFAFKGAMRETEPEHYPALIREVKKRVKPENQMNILLSYHGPMLPEIASEIQATYAQALWHDIRVASIGNTLKKQAPNVISLERTHENTDPTILLPSRLTYEYKNWGEAYTEIMAAYDQSPYNLLGDENEQRKEIATEPQLPFVHHPEHLSIDNEMNLTYDVQAYVWRLTSPRHIPDEHAMYLGGRLMGIENAMENIFFVQLGQEGMTLLELTKAWQDWIQTHGHKSSIVWRQMALKQAVTDLESPQWWIRVRGVARLQRLTGAQIDLPNLLDKNAWQALHETWATFAKEHGDQSPRQWILKHAIKAKLPGAEKLDANDRVAWREAVLPWLENAPYELEQALLVDMADIPRTDQDIDDLVYWASLEDSLLSPKSRKLLEMMLGGQDLYKDADAINALKARLIERLPVE